MKFDGQDYGYGNGNGSGFNSNKIESNLDASEIDKNYTDIIEITSSLQNWTF